MSLRKLRDHLEVSGTSLVIGPTLMKMGIFGLLGVTMM